MRAPERRREGILGRCRDLVGDRGRGPVRAAAVAVEPAQPVLRGRNTHHQQRRERAPRSAGRTRQGRSPGRSAAATARARARTPQGTNRPRSRCPPAPATTAPRRSSSAPGDSARDSTALPPRSGASRRALRCPWGDRSILSPEAARICLIFNSNTQIEPCQRAKGRHPVFKSAASARTAELRNRFTARAAGDRARSALRPRPGAAPAPIPIAAQALRGRAGGCCRCRPEPPHRPRPS